MRVQRGLDLLDAFGDDEALRFVDLHVSAKTKRALREELQVEDMTEVQVRAIPAILDGDDVVARSQTGTGKTLAYLVPIVEMLSKLPSSARQGVGALVLSPTRELAMQIAGAAEQLVTHHGDLGVFCMYGATDINQETKGLQTELLDIMVATPGRLDDHMRNSRNFAELFSNMQFLVLDEADRLLNGFQSQVMGIVRQLPPPEARQGLLFSATFPRDLSEITSLALRPGYTSIDTSASVQATPDQIIQQYAVLRQDQMIDALWKLLKEEVDGDPDSAKVMVFFTTARLTQYYAEVFRRAGLEIIEMHSRRSQSKRTESASTFWTATRGIFFSTDVSARGLDYPEVSAVIHFGAPSSADRYVHRLGRTGRMGKAGRSVVLLHDFETSFLDELKDLPAPQQLDAQELLGEDTPPPELRQPLEPLLVGQAYKAWLGYYKFFSSSLGWDTPQLIEHAGGFAASIGALRADGSHPPLKRRTAQKLGLAQAEGLNVVERLSYSEKPKAQPPQRRGLRLPSQQRRNPPARKSIADALSGARKGQGWSAREGEPSRSRAEPRDPELANARLAAVSVVERSRRTQEVLPDDGS